MSKSEPAVSEHREISPPEGYEGGDSGQPAGLEGQPNPDDRYDESVSDEADGTRDIGRRRLYARVYTSNGTHLEETEDPGQSGGGEGSRAVHDDASTVDDGGPPRFDGYFWLPADEFRSNGHDDRSDRRGDETAQQTSQDVENLETAAVTHDRPTPHAGTDEPVAGDIREPLATELRPPPTPTGDQPSKQPSEQTRHAEDEAAREPHESSAVGLGPSTGLDVISLARILLRRWYVTAIGLVLTAVAAFSVATGIEPTYESTGSLLLAGPEFRGDAVGLETGEEPTAGAMNPYSSGSLTARVLEEVMRSPDVRGEVGSGGDASYVVEQMSRDRAPILYVTTTGTDPSEVSLTYSAVMLRMEEELERRQTDAGVPTTLRVQLDSLSHPTTRLASRNLRRPVASIVGLGGIATLSAAVGLDHLLARRRDR